MTAATVQIRQARGRWLLGEAMRCGEDVRAEQWHLGHLGLNEAVEREVRRMDPYLPADLADPGQIKERAHRLRDGMPY